MHGDPKEMKFEKIKKVSKGDMAGKWNFGWISGRLELVQLQDAFFWGVFFFFLRC